MASKKCNAFVRGDLRERTKCIVTQFESPEHLLLVSLDPVCFT